MPHTSRNFVVAYILLVGLPLLGLAGVLRSGRSLTAPISVDGVWKVDVGTSRLGVQHCAKSASTFSSLVISQSGKSLVLTFNDAGKTVASGSLDGTSLKASVVPERDSSDPGCDQALTLAATIDPKTEPRSLRGAMSLTSCPSCAPVEFRASRQPRGTNGGTH